MGTIIGYGIFLAFFSLIAFFMYGKDKKMSKKGNEIRVKEKTLLGLAAFGGGLGAFIGRIVFRHKTDKGYFSLVIYWSLFIQIAVLALLIFLAVKGA